MPLSINEVFAHRDLLLAEFAIERRELEQKSEKLAASLALSRVELGKRMTYVATLEDKLATVEQGEWEARAQLAKSERRANELELERAAFDKAYFDVAGLLERRMSELADLRKQHEVLGILSDERHVTVVGLESQIVGLQMQLHSMQENLQRTSKALAEKISQVERAERERDQFRADSTASNARRTSLQDSISVQQQLIEKLEGELRLANRVKNKLADEITYLKHSLETATVDIRRLKENLSQQAQARAQDKQALAESGEAHSATQSMLQGALDTVRRDNQALRAELTQLRYKYTRDVKDATIQQGEDKDKLVIHL